MAEATQHKGNTDKSEKLWGKRVKVGGGLTEKQSLMK